MKQTPQFNRTHMKIYTIVNVLLYSSWSIQLLMCFGVWGRPQLQCASGFGGDPKRPSAGHTQVQDVLWTSLFILMLKILPGEIRAKSYFWHLREDGEAQHRPHINVSLVSRLKFLPAKIHAESIDFPGKPARKITNSFHILRDVWRLVVNVNGLPNAQITIMSS